MKEMKILSVNAGSSSLKFTAYEMPEEKVLISGAFERIGIGESFYTIKINGEKIKKEKEFASHKEAVATLIDELLENGVISSLEEIEGVGHRLVHGGEKYAESVVIDEDVVQTVSELSELAPLHNPANLIGVEAFKSEIPSALEVGCFDTAFHQTMRKKEFLYPVPYEWYEKYGVRKYGFHGMSHAYIAGRMAEILGKEDARVISCHIGNGASLCAIKDGKSVDTSMGFTPNAGLMMGTRSGDIDATLIPFIMGKTGKSLDEVINDLNKKSGYLGVSGISSDSRDIEEAVEKGNERAILSQEMYVERIVNYIAEYYLELGGADAIVFTAGVGENSASTRAQIIQCLEPLGIKLDEEKNQTRGKEALISTEDSKVQVYVIPTDEEVMIARDTYRFIQERTI
ncbi:MAG: acetate kinase [Bacilli bacterium]|nr:acetate kinase [Bacilli bacterium]MBR1817430.1 acetate kinase [Bacilli bacterium]